MDSPESGVTQNRPRGLRYLGLLLLVVAALWGGLLARHVLSTGPLAAAVVSPPSATAESAAVAEQTPELQSIGRATPWSVVGMGTPITTPTAEPPPATLAWSPMLLGPPPDSLFGLGDELTFYWTWPELLAEGQQFALYLQSAQGDVLVGSVDEPNLGPAYQLTATVDERAAAGDYTWVVRLEDAGRQAILTQSAPRAIRFIDD